MNERIEVQGPYNFRQALKRLTIDPLQDLDLEAEAIKIPMMVDEKPVGVAVQQTGTFEKPVFHIKTTSRVDEKKVIDQLNDIFHWDTPLETIHEHFQQSDLAPLFTKYRGTPFVCDFSLYGCLMKTIIHQQLNMAFAYELTKRFLTTFGFQHDGLWYYPDPEKVSQLTLAQLRALQFSQRKAEYVIDTSRMIVEGKLNLDSFAACDDEEIVEQLVALRGIGRWTAECFLMFGMGRLDLFPHQDIGIQNGLKKFYRLENKPLTEYMLEKSAAWKPYRTYASLYIWESLETE
ncbi:DNA-3-methyladenine glycosylase II [Evansella caseinilytica]|uniref:DNA-3-methyladenine glycosylase II n=1 Tax=Evansella caseinilytica TaxID=1503961 RepID=A0A1H3H2C1_9BACI|nr:DNA-3-methyladenine glycosylase [Evansella caseinilytica]SDY09676.1 DNA-3-methyladenine glycosylase II [Evansella caseinilytica]